MSKRIQVSAVVLGLLPLGARAQCTNRYSGTGSTATTTGSAAGLYGQYYAGAFHTQAGFSETSPVTYFSSRNSSTQRNEATVNYANAGFGNVNGNGTGTPVNFSARYRGSVQLKAGGTYTFYLTSDDASYMFLGKEATLVSPTPANAFIKNGGDHGNIEKSATISVATTNYYDVQLLLGQGGGDVTIKLEYAGGPDNLARQVVPQAAACAGPSGQTYASNQAPVANNATNAQVYSDNSANTLNPGLSAGDIDGTVVSYQITTLPTAGILKDGATTVTSGSLPYTVAAAGLGNLTYTAAVGTSATVSFQYAATDNSGAQGPAATYTIPVANNQADLATTLVASTALNGASITTAPQGSLIYYTARTTNNGPLTANNVTTTIYLPTGLTGVSLSNSGTYNASNGQATFPAYNLGSGGSASYNIAFTMPGSTVNATASAVSNSADSSYDPNSNNNTGSTYTTPTQVADVSVAINGPTRVLANQAVTYSVVPTNIGPSTATGVTLKAQLATGLAGVVASGPSAGSYNPNTGIVTWPIINSLANGASLVYTVRFNSPTTTGGSITASGSATSTTANGDPVASNNDGTAGQSTITTQVVSTAATLLCSSPGADGNVTLASNFNTYFAGTGTVAAGATSLALSAANTDGASTPIAPGDLLLIIQMQAGDIDATNTDAYGDGVNGDNLAAGVKLNTNFTAGVYEYALAANNVPATGGTLQITQALGFGYKSAAATSTSGQVRYQVIRIPRYNNVTLNANVTAPRWNGLSGGVLALDINGTLDMAGYTLDMVGRGFRGGAGQSLNGAGGVAPTDYRNSNTLNTSANKGEGTTGTPRYVNNNGTILDTQSSGLLPTAVADGYPNGDRGRGAPGNAGGGGTDGNPGGNDQNTGGGGGSNAGRGGIGGNGWNSNSSTGGYGGAGFTQATASRVIMGGGGGAGTTNNSTVASSTTYPANAGVPANGFASSGAAGGGIVLIRTSKMSTNAGTIDVSGAAMSYVPENDGSGGGGAGGSVVLLCNASNGNANSNILQNLTILANGGVGGSNTGGGSPHGPGGGGAGGVAFTSSASSSSSSLQPGANGTTFGFATYGSGVGSASMGQGLSNITRADLPNVVIGCPADIVTTISASATSIAPGSTVTFTATTVNNGLGAANNVRETITLAPRLNNVQPNGQSSFTLDPNTGIQTFADGTTYNPNTGVVTFPLAAALANGGTLANAGTSAPNYVRFVMPSQNVLGMAASVSGGDLDPRLANNDGSLPAANAKVTAVNSISGTVFDDVNYGGGSGRNYATANSSAIASGFGTGTIGSAGTTVELYDTSNNFITTTTTGADGTYGFANIATGSYVVRVVNSTVKSVRGQNTNGLLPVQTFRTNNGVADPDRVGGEDPTKADGPAKFSSVTLRLAGLNPSGGDNTAFIDQVEILNSAGAVVATALDNGSFETPNVGGGFQYGATGSAWTFAGNSGIAANGSGFNPPAAPAGTQAGFLQLTGTADQALALSPGTYTVRLRAAQRGCCSSTTDQTVAILINGTEIGRVQPANNNAYVTYTTGTFTVGALTSNVIAQSVAPITLGSAGLTGVNFGFNFDAIVNTNDTGQGSLRQFILNSNALPNGNLDQAASSYAGGTDPAAGLETSIFMISNGQARNGLRNGLPNQLSSGVACIVPNTAANGALPAITDPNTVLDGTTQTLNIGNTNDVALGTGGGVGTGSATIAKLNGPEVQISGTPGQANSDYGLTLAAPSLTVKGLAVLGFGNSGATGTGNLNGANLYVTGAATSGTLITGNVLGTAATTFPLGSTDPNTSTTRSTGSGILLANLTSGTSVSAAISGNLIGWNGASGIEDLASSATNGVLISGNEIRSNAVLNPTADGVHLGTAGGTVQGNLLAANRGSGIDFDGSAGGILVAANTITGSGAGGTETSGVRAYGQGNTVQGNSISSNAGSGVLVRPGTNASGVAGSTLISQNLIFSNAKLGIDLLNTGDSETAGTVTKNDMNDTDGGKNSSSSVGGNGLLNFPVIQKATIYNGNLLLQGYARAGVTLELFGVGASANASGFGEGAAYLRSMVEGSSADTDNSTSTYSGSVNGRDQGTDNTNNFLFTIPLSSLPSGFGAGYVISATASRTALGTSEFSGNATVVSGPLPVVLVEFTAQAVQQRDALLGWSTASEANSAYFEVERSFDGTTFAAIGRVAAQGTKLSASAYTLTDAGVATKATGPVYYRLRQVDLDGTATYSPQRTISFPKAATVRLGLYPNPVASTTTLDLSQLPATGTVQVQLLDATGRQVRSWALGGGQLQPLELTSLASGSYVLVVTGQQPDGSPLRQALRLTKE
jgi:uncharacterized repeat protein (TIGR01451 family)